MVDGQGLSVLHQGQSQIHPVFRISPATHTSSKNKNQKNTFIIIFFKDLQGTCKKGKLIPWESRNL